MLHLLTYPAMPGISQLLPSYAGNIAASPSHRKALNFSLDADKVYLILVLEAARVYYLLDTLEIQTEQVGRNNIISGINRAEP